jgi:hypothetical protein
MYYLDKGHVRSSSIGPARIGPGFSDQVILQCMEDSTCIIWIKGTYR